MVGFTNVFVDIDGIPTADDFKDRIRKEIRDSDLIVAVIGKNWHDILRQRSKGRERDILEREIKTALRHDKEILPILVDGAEMPSEYDLPPGIAPFHYRSALTVTRDQTLEALVSRFAALYDKVSRARRLREIWRKAYIGGALFAYFVCAILIHIVGYVEYGAEPWSGMAQIWSGFFFWPVACLPFALVALYRPLANVFMFAATAVHARDAITYISPLLIGLAVTVLAMTVEIIGEHEAPWTIYPTLPGCSNGYRPTGPNFDILANYDKQNKLKSQHTEPVFWLENKCWPNALFYLIEPAYRPVTDESYLKERPLVQNAFVALLKRTSNTPYSWLFYVYVLSFSIQIWFAATGVILAMFYVSDKVRRPSDGRILTLPREDAYLCLTYAFVTLMMWVPFRLNTVHLKKLYFCPDITRCSFQAEHYQNDIVLGVMFLIGYVYLTAGLLRKFHRRAQSIVGGAAMMGTVASAFVIFAYSSDIVRMAQSWQFYLRVIIVVLTVLFALWLQFDPNRVRGRDEDEEDNANNGSNGNNAK